MLKVTNTGFLVVQSKKVYVPVDPDSRHLIYFINLWMTGVHNLFALNN